ncbi:hypothetical protein B0T24DRAFT_69400 [Lasiosphaeria ovina]|uniref:Uncharacterized protein n=1 Tax=Lasiosphaeria ovina TaxID=92902 RepID=A0AAE0TY96_9PEZI|nr:hypothetical protein B0T24DRAFT_69400 [Lasiosphaeria ovina]
MGTEDAIDGPRHRQRSRHGAKNVSWRDLPRKGQLVVITLARLSEPLVQTSLQSYMFYQLKWFNPSLSDSVIASQAGVLQFVFQTPSALSPPEARFPSRGTFDQAQCFTKPPV